MSSNLPTGAKISGYSLDGKTPPFQGDVVGSNPAIRSQYGDIGVVGIACIAVTDEARVRIPHITQKGGVAQMDRAPVLQAGGQGFKSLLFHNFKRINRTIWQ